MLRKSLNLHVYYLCDKPTLRSTFRRQEPCFFSAFLSALVAENVAELLDVDPIVGLTHGFGFDHIYSLLFSLRRVGSSWGLRGRIRGRIRGNALTSRFSGQDHSSLSIVCLCFRWLFQPVFRFFWILRASELLSGNCQARPPSAHRKLSRTSSRQAR